MIKHNFINEFNKFEYGDAKDRLNHYHGVLNCYKIASQQLDGKLIDWGNFKPYRPIIYKMPHKGDNLLTQMTQNQHMVLSSMKLLENQ